VPSLFTSLFQLTAIPVLEAALAEVDPATGQGQIVRYPEGDWQRPDLVLGIWNEIEARDGTERGHEIVRTVELTLFDLSLAVDARDHYALVTDIGSAALALSTVPPPAALWKVRHITSGTDPWLDLTLERRDLEIRTGKGGRVL